MTDTVQINLRVDAALERALEEIAAEQSLRKTDVARQYLVNGVKEWRVARAVSRYQQRRTSLERAAADAGLSVYEMMDELRERGVPLDQTTPEEARQELQSLLEGLAETRG